MSRIGPKNTKPELAVRRLLHAAGRRFRLHRKGLPGTPDIVFGPKRAAIFVHGCFWHGHSCRLGRAPQTRTDFWKEKMAANRARDARKVDELVGAGWRVLTVWQCALRDPQDVLQRSSEFLDGEETTAEIAERTGKG